MKNDEWVKNREYKDRIYKEPTKFMKCPDCGNVRIMTIYTYNYIMKDGKFTGRCQHCVNAYIQNKKEKIPFYSRKNDFLNGYIGIYIPVTDKYYPQHIPKSKNKKRGYGTPSIDMLCQNI